MPKSDHYVEVVLPLSVPGTYTYIVPKRYSSISLIGKRVIVSFGAGRRLYTGIVISYLTSLPEYDLKELLDVFDDEPCVNEKVFKLWSWISKYYMCFPGEVMNTALPGNMNLSSESRFILNFNKEISLNDLNEKEKLVVNALESKRELKIKELNQITSLKNSLSLVKHLVDREIVTVFETVQAKYLPKKKPRIKLNEDLTDPVKIEQVLKSLLKAPAQQKLLYSFLKLIDYDDDLPINKFIPKDILLKSDKNSLAALNALIKKKILYMEYIEESRINISSNEASSFPILQDFQLKCFNEIKLQHKKKDVVLLHGVTSSGKTEIYSHLIKEVVEGGRQVLYLLPEIALTSQIINRLRKYFGNIVAVYHSGLNANERTEVWKRISGNSEGEIKIVLGARSAVFLPFDNLGLIIVDEEHDRSFKQQDPAPRYEARDTAVVLAGIHKAKVLLGSATPSLESIENAMSGKYGFSELKKRYGGVEMPEIQVVDISEEYRKKRMKYSFSPALYKEMSEKLDSGEQIIIFQNRRGYAPLIICNNCSSSPVCVNCDVALTYHKGIQSLICHYCGYKIGMTINCRSCENGSYKDMGKGTEKIEEELKELFPDAILARFDLDSTRRKNAFQNLIDKFERGEIDVLIGTQMVTKGLDFENVGLVGIINADNLLRFPDFRSFERTFQMLTQVAGRSGRKNKRGKVIIQTFDPLHPVIDFVTNSDYKGFVSNELEERMTFRYPPFYRIIEVKLKHTDRQKLFNSALSFGKALKGIFKEQLLGPEFNYIERVRNQYSMHFILKVSKKSSISNVKNKLTESIADFNSMDTFKSIKVQIDVDPY